MPYVWFSFFLSIFYISIHPCVANTSTSDDRILKLENEMTNLKEFTERAIGQLSSLLEENRKELSALKSENKDLRKQLIDTQERLAVFSNGKIAEKDLSYKNVKNKHFKNVGHGHQTNVKTSNKVQRQRRLLVQTPTLSTVSQPVAMKKIGFYATATGEQHEMGIDQTVKFHNVITNTGNGFDHVTSAFRAPVSGMYHFSATVLSLQAVELRCAVMRNGIDVGRIFSGDGTTFSTGSMSLVLELSKNDDVWIKIVDYKGVHVGGSLWTSFSGFLIE